MTPPPDTTARVSHFLSLPYTIVLKRDEDGDVVAAIAELSGCMTHAENESDAIRSLRDAQTAWLVASLEAGLEIPLPFTEIHDALPRHAAHAQQAEEIARWREAAYFAGKARNLRALRDRVAAGEAVAVVAEDYRVPVAWVADITAPGWDLLSGDAEAERDRMTLALRSLVAKWMADADVADESVHHSEWREGVYLTYRKCADELEAALAGEKVHP